MRSVRGRSAVVVGLILLLPACKGGHTPEATPSRPTLSQQVSGTEQRLQAISAIDERVAWISGLGGTWARTADGGDTWQTGVVAGGENLQFRDVHAVDFATAYLLSAGPGDLSRIYKTSDGGTTWTLQFLNNEPEAFFDCMDFWDDDSGLAFSDSVDGTFLVIRTLDGGAHWQAVDPAWLPPASGPEGGFAASGTCVVTAGHGTAWIGTGAGQTARVLQTADRGQTWTAVATPIVGGTTTSGITSLCFRDPKNGLAVGGDISASEGYSDNVALTFDGGRSWSLGGRPQLEGPIYGCDWVPTSPTPTVVAVGPDGADYSTDGGLTWQALDSLSYWSVDFVAPGNGWMVGPDGRIMKVSLF